MKKTNRLLLAAVTACAGMAAQAEEHMIVLTGFSYFPTITYAEPGDTIRFINESGEQQTVVGRETGWIVGPLEDTAEGTLVVTEETELAFFSAYTGEECQGEEGSNTCYAEDTETGETDYGEYDEAPVRAEITFEDSPING